MSDSLKKEFSIALLIWIVSIVVFFITLSSLSSGSGVVTLIAFVIGSIAFLYGLNKLALIVNNMSKLRTWSLLTWVLTLVIFAIMVGDSNQLAEHRWFSSDFWGVVGVGDIVLGVAAFISLISSFGSLPKRVDPHNDQHSRSYAKTSLSSKISDELDDIIFIPKRKKGLGVGVVLAGAILLGLMTISFFSDGETNNPQSSPTTITANLASLTIVDPKISGNNQQALTGTIRNSSSNLATDVVIRVDFAKDKDMKQTFDTRYFPVDYVAANGAFTFNIPFDLNYSGQYWWNAKIEDASFE